MKKEYDIDLIFSLYKDGVLCKEIAEKVNLFSVVQVFQLEDGRCAS